MSVDHRWSPDAATVDWCFGVANHERVKDAIRQDVGLRAGHLSPDSDEYWLIVAEAATEAILYDLFALARKAGTVFPNH